MQAKRTSKSKLQQFFSIKQFQSTKDQQKKHLKNTNSKSNLKNKTTNKQSQSKSKIKQAHQSVKQNQNKNTINIPLQQSIKIKKSIPQEEKFKKNSKKISKISRTSSEKMIRTKSTTKLIDQKQKNREAPPLLQFIHHNQDKSKTSRNHTTRSQKEKKSSNNTKSTNFTLKKTGSVSTILTKKTLIPQRNQTNRGSIKTQISSKTTSVMRQDEKSKMKKKKQKNLYKKQQQLGKTQNPISHKQQKRSKLQIKIQKSILYSQVSFQQFCQQNPYESAIVCNDHFYLPQYQNKTKTQGAELNRSFISKRLSFEKILQQTAALKIQKAFRGYITRKYIQQAKLIVSNVKIIQEWWRSILLKKRLKINKITSIENSLITIKDFNDTIKTERNKMLSQSKQNTLSNKKINFKDIIKNILEQDNQQNKHDFTKENELNLSNLDTSFINKHVYVQHKIKGQINSQKIFNSPKNASPIGCVKTPTNKNIGIRQFFSSQNEKNKIKQKLNSPRVLLSPGKLVQPPKTTPRSLTKQPTNQQAIQPLDSSIKAFDSSYSTIQEISFIFVTFLRSNPNELERIMKKIVELQFYRTKIVLYNWNKSQFFDYEIDENQIQSKDYEFLQSFQRPNIFQPQLRKQIITFPQLFLYLNQKSIEPHQKNSSPVHKSFMDFVFDVLEEAIYKNFNEYVLQWPTRMRIKKYLGYQSLLMQYFSEALGQMYQWGEMKCGLIPLCEQDNSEEKESRLKLFVGRVENWDLGKSSKLGIKMETSQLVLFRLIEEIIFEISGFYE